MGGRGGGIGGLGFGGMKKSKAKAPPKKLGESIPTDGELGERK